ncbi:MAG: OmpL47-type beta-barrel domain-containing protein [Candidatus Aquicultorales bacterium]
MFAILFLIVLLSGSALATVITKTITANPSMTQGSISGGGFADAQTSNDLRLQLAEAGGILFNPYKLDARFDSWQPFSEATEGQVIDVRVLIEGNASATSDTWYVQFWDYATGNWSTTWYQAGTGGFGTADAQYATTAVDDPATIQRYMGPGGAFRMRLGDGYTQGSQGSDGSQTTLRLDHFRVEFTYDNLPPASTISAPSNGAVLNGLNYTISGTASDDLSGVTQVEVSTDGGSSWNVATGTATWSYSWTLPADGSYNIRTRATDAKGNVETPGAGVTVTVDKTAPTTTLSTTPLNPDGANGWFVTAPTVTLSRNEPGTTYYQWDGTGGAWTTYSGSFAVPEGEHTLYFYSVDAYSNSETYNSQLVKVDTADPTTTASTDPASPDGANGWFVTTPTVTLSSEAGSTTYYQWDGTGGAWTTYTAPLSALSGDHTLYYYSVDGASNNEAPKSQQIKVDGTAPSSTVGNPLNGDTIGGPTYEISGTAADGVSGVALVEVSINGGAWQAATGTTSWSYTWTIGADGSYTIRSRATDVAGNVQTPGPGVTVTVDNSAPTTTLTTAPPAPDGANGWFVTAPTVTLSRNEPGTTYYQWDGTGGAWTTYSGPFAALAGSHTLFYYSVDTQGNAEMYASQDFDVDSTASTSSVADPTNGAVLNGASYAVSGSASDSGSGVALVEVSINGGAWQAATGTTSWSYTWTIGADGSYTIRSRATDTAGNVEAPGSGVTVMVDSAPPVTAATTIPATPDGMNGWFKVVPSITISRNEPGSAYFQWDGTGGSWTTYTGAISGPEGNHTLYFYSIDSVGNTEDLQLLAVKTDTGVPAAPTLSGVAAGSTQINLGWNTVSDSPSGVLRYEIYNGDTNALITSTTGTTLAITGLSPSTTYRYYVKTLDNAGNTSAAGNTVMVQTESAADTQAPTAPAGLIATVLSASQIKLMWSPSTDNVGVTGYRVFNADTDELLGTTTVLNYTYEVNANGNTPVGTDVSVDLGLASGTSYRFYVTAIDGANNFSGPSSTATAVGNGASLTFSNVSGQGTTTVAIAGSPPDAPDGIVFRGTVYNITTTALYGGSTITVGLPYDVSLIQGSESDVKLYHYNGSSWDDITTAVDTDNDIVYGEVTSLSPFAVGESEPLAVPASSEASALGLSIVGLAYAGWRTRSRREA